MAPLRHIARVLATHALVVAGVTWGVAATEVAREISLLAALNAVTSGWYLADKLAARSARSRIPEAALLLMAALFGGLGALLAIHLARHKTRKAAFRWGVPVLLVAQLALLVTWAP